MRRSSERTGKHIRRKEQPAHSHITSLHTVADAIASNCRTCNVCHTDTNPSLSYNHDHSADHPEPVDSPWVCVSAGKHAATHPPVSIAHNETSPTDAAKRSRRLKHSLHRTNIGRIQRPGGESRALSKPVGESAARTDRIARWIPVHTAQAMQWSSAIQAWACVIEEL